jgi:hypothetical protein
MTSRLKQLLIPIGVIVVSGLTYLQLRAPPEVLPKDLENAGCVPARIRCDVRMHCGGPRYGLVETKAYLCPPLGAQDGGRFVELSSPPSLVTRWPRSDAGVECFEPINDCTFIETGECTDDEVCSGTGALSKVRVEQNICACWQPDAGACSMLLPDGGPGKVAPAGATLPPGWVGPGCRRKPCFEVSGEPGSWPAECPDQWPLKKGQGPLAPPPKEKQ